MAQNRFKLRSTGPGGSLWVEDTTSGDGYEIAEVKFEKPEVKWDTETLKYYSLDDARGANMFEQALTEWRMLDNLE